MESYYGKQRVSNELSILLVLVTFKQKITLNIMTSSGKLKLLLLIQPMK